MEIKIGVVETHHYTGVRELERVDLEKFPIIKYYLDVNPEATEEDLLKYIKTKKPKNIFKSGKTNSIINMMIYFANDHGNDHDNQI